jgi:hypothetical protein
MSHPIRSDSMKRSWSRAFEGACSQYTVASTAVEPLLLAPAALSSRSASPLGRCAVPWNMRCSKR